MARKKHNRRRANNLDKDVFRASALYRTPPPHRRELLEKRKNGNVTTFVYRELDQTEHTWRLLVSLDSLLRTIFQLLLDVKIRWKRP